MQLYFSGRPTPKIGCINLYFWPFGYLTQTIWGQTTQNLNAQCKPNAPFPTALGVWVHVWSEGVHVRSELGGVFVCQLGAFWGNIGFTVFKGTPWEEINTYQHPQPPSRVNGEAIRLCHLILL